MKIVNDSLRNTNNSEKYGLFAAEKSVPLQQIDCTVTAGELISQVHVKQIYEIHGSAQKEGEGEGEDHGPGGVEVNFRFPLENRASVHVFHVDIEHLRQADGQWHHYDTVEGRVKPKQEAREEYEDAMVEGRSSGFLMEKRAKSNDFQVSFMVRDPPRDDKVLRQRLTIHLKYVAELDLAIAEAADASPGDEDDVDHQSTPSEEDTTPSSLDAVWCRLMLPLTMYPKYVMSNVDRDDDNDQPEGGDPEQEGEPRPQNSYAVASSMPYRFGITVEFAEQSRVTSVKSPSHEVQIAEDHRQVTLRDNEKVPVDRDFRLYFRTEQLVAAMEQSNSLLEGDEEKTESAVEQVVIEEMDAEQQDEKERYALMFPIVAPTLLEDHEGTEWYNSELIFVVDCSGSMSGSPIREAGRTLKLFLQSLPLDQGIRINVLKFGSRFNTLFRNSELLTVKTLNEAMKLAENLQANLGGTELFHPLKHLMKGKGPEGYTRQLFVLTDGEIFNTEQTLNVVRENRTNVRVYTFGIGSCDHNLVQGLADAGNGFAEFITYGEKIDAKVMGQLKRALKPTWVNCTIEWGDDLCASAVKPCFHAIQPLYYGTRHLLFAFLDTLPKDACQLKFTAETGRSKDKKFIKRFTLHPEQVQRGKAIHTLGAASLIKEMEGFGKPEIYGLKSKDEVKEQIKLLSLRYQILSSECSFVAVSDKYAENEAQQKALSQVDVPTPMPTKNLSRLRSSKSAIPGVDLMAMSAPALSYMPNVRTKSKKMKKGGVLAGITSFFTRSSVGAPAPAQAQAQASASASYPVVMFSGVVEDAGFLTAPPPPPPEGGMYDDDSSDGEEVEEQEDYLEEEPEMQQRKAMPVMKKEKRKESSSTSAQKPSAPSVLSIDDILFSLDPTGFWKWTSAHTYLSKLLGKTAESKSKELEDAMKEMSIKDDKCLATAVVIVLLEQHFSKEKVTWNLISKKAKGWLKRQTGKMQQSLLQKVSAILSESN